MADQTWNWKWGWAQFWPEVILTTLGHGGHNTENELGMQAFFSAHDNTTEQSTILKKQQQQQNV